MNLEFVEKLNNDLTVKSFEKETEKAIFVTVVRYTQTTKIDNKTFSKKRGFNLFEDKIWIPKSAIENNKVKTWFAEKNEISIVK